MHHGSRPQARRYRAQRAVSVIALSIATIRPAVAAGQATATDPKDTTHAQTQAPFFTLKDALLAGAFAGATVIMFPLDKRFALHLQDSATHADRLFAHASTNLEIIASPGAYVIGATFYAVGRLGRFDRLADLGWHGTEAVLLADGFTYALKGIAGRSRPFISNDSTPGDFHPGKGFRSGDYSSFPSGHTSTAFAAASAVTNETARWWPRSVWVVGPLMYGGATGVGLSRMYHNKHWASDVVLGAAIGTFTGRKVVQYQHGHPDNKLDKIMLATSLVPDGHGGTLLMVSLPAP